MKAQLAESSLFGFLSSFPAFLQAHDNRVFSTLILKNQMMKKHHPLGYGCRELMEARENQDPQ